MRFLLFLFAISFISPAIANSPAIDKEITVYAARDTESLKPILDAFTTSTRIKVNVVSGSNEELLARLKQEGKQTGADLLLLDDLVYLGQASRSATFVPFSSNTIEKNIHAPMIAPSKRWFALSYRARIII